MEKRYLFIEPEIVEDEGVIYRLGNCGAIESYHIIILHPQFPKRESEGKAIMRINLLLPGGFFGKN